MAPLDRIRQAVTDGALDADRAAALVGFVTLAPEVGAAGWSHATWYRRLAQLRALGVDTTAFGASARTS